ncbi:MAG: hypothetical protein IKH90_03015 [Ruminococcus sp.]|nr:hypothetical protein [Ruminococcus sp.]
MDSREFILCQGVSLRSTGKVSSAFSREGGSFSGILSAQQIIPAAKAFIKDAKAPIFFFVELPKEDDSEMYDVYYLDNCTKPVAEAIIKRFGDVLVNDGISRFGFGSNSAAEEIYFTDYQEFSAYIGNAEKFAASLKKIGVEQTEKFCTLWDEMSDDNMGCLSMVEVNGETVFDIPDALKDAGMYKDRKE